MSQPHSTTETNADYDADNADSRENRQSPLHAGLLWIQGTYYLVTGVWPLVSIRSFQAVTGPKTDHLVTGREEDHWLVMTVGVLITASALTLLLNAWRGQRSVEVVFLAIANAVALTAIDVIYVSREVLHPIYLLDATLEVILIVAWIVVLVRRDAVKRASSPS